MSIDGNQARMREAGRRSHGACLICGPRNPRGLRLRFRARDDGTVEAAFAGGPDFQGYAGILHGGVIASLLDGAMTHCLFAHGQEAVTAELTVRYLKPVRADLAAVVRARLVRATPPLFRMEGELVQRDARVARATALFMKPFPVDGTPALAHSVKGRRRLGASLSRNGKQRRIP